jgi:V8-like Glu-specific endopeptidase
MKPLTIARWMLVSFAAALVGIGAIACSMSESPAANDQNPQDSKGTQEVIYGDDNRTDFYSEKDASLRTLSESTVALMSSSQIGAEVNGLRPLTGANYGASLGLCSDERFTEQNTGAFCSGFLIADDLVVTAGHCITDLKECGETSFVFGYRVAAPGVLPVSIPSNEVYSCASLIHTQSPSDGADFAIVKLDRPVPNHAPLLPRLNGDVKVGDSLTVMGYPEGLPLKFAGGAVRSVNTPGFFVTNVDTYGGNSGSAILNSKTHEVEGVLVRGEKDFEWTAQGCARSYRCKADACRGEDVTRIGEVLKALQAP